MEHELQFIQSTINGELIRVSNEVCGPLKEPPRLTFKSESSYDFKVENDTETGSRVRNMMMLDYTLLKQTPLPAISEDSVSLKQISDDWLLKLLELFDTLPKQSFIAIDKAESLTDEGDIPDIIMRIRSSRLIQAGTSCSDALGTKRRNDCFAWLRRDP